MCTKKEWKTRESDVKQGKRLQGRASFQPKRQNISFQRLSLWMSVLSLRLHHHFWSVTWQPSPSCTLTNGISGERFTVCVAAPVLTIASYIFLNPMTSSFRSSSPNLFSNSTAITLLVSICYYITHTAPGHQSHTEHTQNWLIILAYRAISPLMISLAHTFCTQSGIYFTPHFIKRPTNSKSLVFSTPFPSPSALD